MNRNLRIKDIYAREILDSRGNPTIEVEILTEEDDIGSASVPSGRSKGEKEAVELRDHDERYHGMGVSQAVRNVNDIVAEHIIGMNIFDQKKIDQMLIKLDGTEDKSNIGANAILAVSLAAARTASVAMKIPLYRYIGGIRAGEIPLPMMNILNGGKHADNTIDLQEFMIIPIGADCFQEGLRMCSEIYFELKEYLYKTDKGTAVGDEGGFTPDLKNAEEALELLVKAVRKAGYKIKEDIVFSIDAAAGSFYDREQEKYIFQGESKMSGHQVVRSTDEMITYYNRLTEQFPIVSIEDPFAEEDDEGWKKITDTLGEKIQIVGDDLFVTNERYLKEGIIKKEANTILIKLNQIGTLTEALKTVETAQKAGYQIIVSHRSGETEDSLIADFAVGVNAGQIKTGAPCRGERTAKYNQLLRIEESVENNVIYRIPFK